GVIGSSLCRLRLVFFFQAEDGIRDFHVTGVQTCALPILKLRATLWERVAAVALGLLIAAGLTVAMAHSRLTEAGVVTGEPASHGSGGAQGYGQVDLIGKALLGSYLAPFETAAVLLLLVMIGAAYMARRRRPS